MIKKNNDNRRIVKIGPVEMGMKPFAFLIAGAVITVFILKSGYDINLGNWSCRGKPADVKVNFYKSAEAPGTSE